MKKLYLHVGVGKTGSTTIQHALGSQADRLKELGYLYPTSLGVGHAKMAQIFRSDQAVLHSPYFKKQTTYQTPAQLRAATIAEFDEEVASSSADTVVIVNETLYGLPTDQFDELLRFFKGYFDHITVVFFVRRQDELIVSSYKQGIIAGATITLEQYVRKSTQDNSGGNRADQMDYAMFLDGVSERHPDVTLRTAMYHKSIFQETSLLDCFSGLINLPRSGKSIIRNPSLDAACAEYLRWYNQCSNGKLPPGILIQCLKTLSSGRDYVLSDDAREKISERFRDSNLRVASLYLKRGGELLTAPVFQDLKSDVEADQTIDSSLHFRVAEWLCEEYGKEVEARKHAWKRFSQVKKRLSAFKQGAE